MDKNASCQGSQFFVKTILLILLMSVVLTGCRFPWQPAEETSPTQQTESEGPDSQAGEEEPVATEEPRADAPSPCRSDSHPNSAIARKNPIKLYFNQPMDTDSVKQPSILNSRQWAIYLGG